MTGSASGSPTWPAPFHLVGNTPLVEVPSPNPDVAVMAKLEYYNPSGSVKDRAVKGMLVHAVQKGLLENRTVIEATSGNTGIALAMMVAALRRPVEIALPANASQERKQILAAYGAKVYLTDPLEGTDGAQQKLLELLEQSPDKYYYPDQYSNDCNWQAHLTGTAVEIWRQTRGQVTHFVAGIGTSGTFIGTSRFLKPRGVVCVAVQPDNPLHGLEGWKHLGSAKVPPIYAADVPDQVLEVSTDEAFGHALAASRTLGFPLSPSAAANFVAARRVAAEAERGIVVTVFPDNFMKYMNEKFWSDARFAAGIPRL